MRQEKVVIFLYTRLPDYFYQCVLHFTGSYGLKAVIVMHSGDANTGYRFSDSESVKLVYKKDIRDLPSFVKEQGPAAIYVTGWTDKDYMAVAKMFRSHLPVIMGLDNPWKNSLKQRLLCLASPLLLRSKINKLWVAGTHQYVYALRLGYGSGDILRGLYAADEKKYYTPEYLAKLAEKRGAYPKTLLFVGRFVDYKQPLLLSGLFHELQEESPDEYGQWKLVMAGEGPLREEIASRKYKNVSLTGFVAPEALPDLYAGAGVFCFPSREEHWGVVVQEAALAGLPLLLSDTVFAGYEFLINGFNGVRFRTGDRVSLKYALAGLMRLKAEQLWEMGQRSKALAARISKDTWSGELNAALQQNM